VETPVCVLGCILTEMATKSGILCHQLIWNVRTYNARNDDGEYVYEIGAVVDALCSEIKANMNEDDEIFYSEEFTFFDAVTVCVCVCVCV